MKRILCFWLIWLLLLIGTAGAVELVRQKNTATYVYFPITNTSGDIQTGCVTDTEIDAFADGSAPDGFADCTNEATEVGTTGWYYLSLTNTEMNNDYIALRVQISSGCAAVSQRILIRTMVGDPLNMVTTDTVIDSTYTLAQILKMQDAVLFGESSGGGTSTIIFRNVADSQDEITATVDANGNRTGMSYAGSP